jgi:type II secretory pathway pseudopilin PulG
MLRLSRSRPRTNHGFTLLDVTLTVVILGVLASAAVPKFLSSLGHHRAKAAAARIAADLTFARQLAMSKSQDIAVQFTTVSNEYVLEGVEHPDHTGESYLVRIGESPYESELVSADLGDDERIVFNAFGLPESGGKITVQSGRWRETVTIDPDTGKASGP